MVPANIFWTTIFVYVLYKQGYSFNASTNITFTNITFIYTQDLKEECIKIYNGASKADCTLFTDFLKGILSMTTAK